MEMSKTGMIRKAGGRNNPKNYNPPKKEDEDKDKGFRKGMKDKLMDELRLAVNIEGVNNDK